MKKTLYSLLFLSIFLLHSCGEDSIPEQPPTEVSNIDVVVIEGTEVRIRWKEAEDPNGDDIHYDIVVNNFLVDSHATGDFVEYDIAPLLSRSSRKELSRGVNINLNIKIKAFDTNSNVSETVEANRNVFINRNPGNFDFIDINIDTYSYSWLDITWSPSPDEDGDTVTYDIYLNDLLLKENYIIDSNASNGFGTFYYNQNFYSYIDGELIIKIVADDNSGGKNEITKSFNFRATDIDLGSLTVPYVDSHNFTISSNEPDNKLGFKFSISENTGISLFSQTGVEYILRDTNGNYLSSGYNRFFNESLSAGNYYIEIYNYSGNGISGSFSLNLRNPQATDVDLGELSVPYLGTHSFNATTEPDNKIEYLFSITESTGAFIMQTGSMNSYELLDSNGNWLGSNYDNLMVNSIPPGSYKLRVYNDQNPTANFTFTLEDPTLTDIDLGTLSIPYLGDHTFSISNNEPDNKIGYAFTITETTGLSLSSNSQNNYYLRDSNGNYFSGNYNGIKYEQLSSGSYIIEVEKNGSASSGDFTLALQLANYTDQDLGLIDTLPYSKSFDTSILSNEPDSKITYKFETNKETEYAFSSNADIYLTLLDQNKNYITDGYNNLSGTITNNGVYYIEILYYGSQVNGNFTIDFN